VRKAGFPQPLQPHAQPCHAAMLSQLKHRSCHLNLDKLEQPPTSLRLRSPGQMEQLIDVQLGSELLVAPLALFHPTLLLLTGEKGAATSPAPPLYHHNDPHNYATPKRSQKEVPEWPEDQDLEESPAPLSGLLGLEDLVLQSLDRCPLEVRLRVCSCVLLVGASASFPGLGQWLARRLSASVPQQYRPENIEVLTSPKDLEPGMVAWKGAALMTGLEGNEELWISQEMWRKGGVKVLREKLPFLW